VRAGLPQPVEDATEVLAAMESPATTRIIAQNTAATRIAQRQHSMPPAPKRRRRGPLIGAIIALLVLAGGAAAFLLPNIGGATKVTVPDVTGLSESAATAKLAEVKLEVGGREEKSSVTVLEGNVITTDPQADAEVAEGAQITLILSSGKAQGTVPRVVGKTYDEAVADLAVDQFTPKKELVFSDKPVDEVVKQDPLPGVFGNQGDTVTLFVSKGPEPVTVPSLALVNEGEAKTILEDAGLKLGKVTTRETTKRAPGLVVGQDPAAGESVKKGSIVDIVVSKAPVPKTIPMPDVVGNSADAARAKLKGLGFADPIAETVDDESPAGTVVGQGPEPGTQVDPGTTPVTITVSRGPAAPPTDPGVAPPAGTTAPTP
jgi:serine/threonine-protein kinase